jgi:hypothetical protein
MSDDEVMTAESPEKACERLAIHDNDTPGPFTVLVLVDGHSP